MVLKIFVIIGVQIDANNLKYNNFHLNAFFQIQIINSYYN